MNVGSLALSGKPSFLSGILSAIFERGRAQSRRAAKVHGRNGRVAPAVDLPALCAELISDEHGEASRVAMAS